MAEHDDSRAGKVTPQVLLARISGQRLAVAISVAALAALGGIAGWDGYRLVEQRRDVQQQGEFVEAARQAAVNLTTIDHATVDADIKRILDSSTGAFRDDFQERAEPFATVVRQAQSKSVGTVTSAALESHEGDRARVLVVMSVEMSSAGTPQQVPQVWRMSVGVDDSGESARVSDVEFVS